MAESADVDAGALESFLAAELDAAVTGIEVLHDGLNLSVAVETDDDRYVLRRPTELRDTERFNDLRREYELLERLDDTAVPAPSPVLFCEDESVLDAPFFLTTYLDGSSVPLGSPLPERFRDPESRGAIADRLIETLAEIHTLDVEQFEGVCDYESPLDELEHAFDRLEEVKRTTGPEYPKLRSVGDWLRRNAPADHETALVHGDYRPSNLLFVGTDRPEVGGVLDWETAMLADPLTELGYLLLRWRDDGDPSPPLDELERKYDDDVIEPLRDANAHGLAPFTNEPGSPTRQEMFARYEAETGITVDDGSFYLAHAAFMLGTVWADLHRHRTEAGLESDLPAHAEYAAMLAERHHRGEFSP
ncbi:phosphotransferase family protein [Halobacteriales archaeon QS_1_68_20]|nr:MAG: phosphotransferase family protein [Halobacteriales archaeon QS_1_68_20]